MSGSCIICKDNFIVNNKSIKCAFCDEIFHNTCVKIKDSASKSVADYKSIFWFCNTCVVLVNNNLKILPKINDLETKTDNLIKKINSLEIKPNECFSTAPPKSSEGRSYANALRKSKEGIIIVKPNGENATGEDYTNMKEDIQQKINPGNIGVGIKSMKNTKNGSVVIKVRDKDEAQKLQQDIANKLGNSVCTKIPEKKNPCIKIVGIERNYEDDQLIDTLKNQNETLITTESRLAIKVTKKMVKTYMSIIECDPTTFQKIMLKSEGKLFIGCRACRVFEYVSVLRCFNCCQYGHTSIDCKNQKICGKCNSTSHENKDCDRGTKCTNCCISNNNFNTKYDINPHITLSALYILV